MRVFGLIGFPLTHSFSVKYFLEKFKREKISGCSYQNFPISSIELFQSIIKSNTGLEGLNVTIPYKGSVMAHLDRIEDTAKEIGAVNTIKISRLKDQIILTGFNTDAYGFRESLIPILERHKFRQKIAVIQDKKTKIEYSHIKALILGTGGAAKSVAYELNQLNIDFVNVSRSPSGEKRIAYNTIDEEMMRTHLLIINTSPLGMYPAVYEYPDIPYQYLTSDHILYDLIYNPEETEFLKKGKEKHVVVKNGYEMLTRQAEKSWEIWNSKS